MSGRKDQPTQKDADAAKTIMDAVEAGAAAAAEELRVVDGDAPVKITERDWRPTRDDILESLGRLAELGIVEKDGER